MTGLSVRRLWRIASREYLSYVRTVGFWLSLGLMPIGLALGAGLPALLERSGPEVSVAIVDLTGRGYAERVEAAVRERQTRDAAVALRLAATAAAGPNAGEAVEQAFDAGGLPAARARLREVAPRAGEVDIREPLLLAAAPPQALTAPNPEAAARVLRPYLNGDRSGPSGRITAAAVIHLSSGGRPALDFWTTELADTTAEDRLSAALRHVVRADDLRALGVDPARLAALEAAEPVVRTLSPSAEGGAEVSLRDRLPAIVGFVMGMLLWSVVLTGAGILLNSVIEEKSSRILEVLLASASTWEIMGGKILGVALVTLTVMGAWAGLGSLLLLNGAPGFAGDLAEVLIGRGLIPYFALYLIGGYLMYAALFAALGSFCETTREAQTLLGPLMVLLTIPVLFMSLAIRNPDAELLRILSWVPPFTPFIMAARAGGQPPLWEVAGTAAVMALTIAGVLWLSGRVFRAGALSTVKLEPRALLTAFRRR